MQKVSLGEYPTILANFFGGIPIEEIAENYEVDPATIWRVLQKQGVTGKHKSLERTTRDGLICVEYEGKETVEEIAKKHGLAKSTIYYILKKHGAI